MDLASNLLSEGIGIFVTVVLIDGLSRLRERRRWKGVRLLVLHQLELACGDLLSIWAAWLSAVRRRGIPAAGAMGNKTLETPSGGAPVLPLKEYEDICRFCGGDAVIGDTDKALVDVVIPKNVQRGLEEQLIRLALPQDDRAWVALARSLSKEVEKITGLLSRLPHQMPDVSQGAEGIYTILRVIDPRNQAHADWNSERAHADRVERIAYSIGMTMSMRKYLRAIVH